MTSHQSFTPLALKIARFRDRFYFVRLASECEDFALFDDDSSSLSDSSSGDDFVSKAKTGVKTKTKTKTKTKPKPKPKPKPTKPSKTTTKKAQMDNDFVLVQYVESDWRNGKYERIPKKRLWSIFGGFTSINENEQANLDWQTMLEVDSERHCVTAAGSHTRNDNDEATPHSLPLPKLHQLPWSRIVRSSTSRNKKIGNGKFEAKTVANVEFACWVWEERFFTPPPGPSGPNIFVFFERERKEGENGTNVNVTPLSDTQDEDENDSETACSSENESSLEEPYTQADIEDEDAARPYIKSAIFVFFERERKEGENGTNVNVTPLSDTQDEDENDSETACSSENESSLEEPYTQADIEDEDAARPYIKSAQKKNEPINPGDTIFYYNPVFKGGTAAAERTAVVLEVFGSLKGGGGGEEG